MSEPLRVLYFVEGHTDIRFLLGLSRRFRLTMMTPGPAYRQSGLAERVAAEHVRVEVVEVPGGRLGFQIRSLGALWRRARAFDVIFSQEMLRGSLNACVVGRLRGVPVVTHTALAPLEYFQCRRERGQLGWLSAWLGSGLIRLLLTLNGRLAHRSLALGPYLLEQTSRYASRVGLYHYYGVDTDYFSPVEPERRAELRRLLELPPDTFLALFSSRVSHEKDPETVLKAARLARGSGLGVTVLNLSGGYAHFLRLAEEMWPGESAKWVMGRPAVHPMRALAPYYQAADVLVQASLAEGAGLSPLEALACGVPVVATAVGGLAALLEEHARLVPRRDAPALAENLLWVASHRAEARATALRGREFVEREWRSERAFQQLREVLEEVARQRGRPIR